MIYVENLSKVYKSFERRSGIAGAIKDLFHREYKDFVAVDEISFHIPEGQIVGFIGPNGAGKTTTIKMLTGIMHPTGGEIKAAGFKPFEERKKLAQVIGVLFGKRSNLLWDLPVDEGFNMLMELYNVGDKGKGRLTELKRIVDIEPLLHVPVRKLSLGQRTLCEIVASLLHNPKILFLDEPTIGLDLFAKEQVRNLVKYVNESWGVTVFLTTHDLSDIRILAKQVILISKGKILYDGTLNGLLEKSKELPKAITLSVESNKENTINILSNIKGVNSIDIDEEGRLAVDYIQSMVSSSEIIKAAMECANILDITISDVDIEEVVRYMYNGEEVK